MWYYPFHAVLSEWPGPWLPTKRRGFDSLRSLQSRHSLGGKTSRCQREVPGSKPGARSKDFRPADVMAAVLASEASVRKGVGVQVPRGAPSNARMAERPKAPGCKPGSPLGTRWFESICAHQLRQGGSNAQGTVSTRARKEPRASQMGRHLALTQVRAGSIPAPAATITVR